MTRIQWLRLIIAQGKDRRAINCLQEEKAEAGGFAMPPYPILETTEEIRRWPYYLGMVE